MSADAAKIMFEVYRESGFNRRYHVVYFTELDEDNRDRAIEAALSGEHVYDGFIAAAQGAAAKQVLADVLNRLNDGASVTPGEIEAVLAPFLMA